LKITDPDETLDEEVLVALEDVHSYPKSYDRINTLLLEGPDLNQRTFVLIAHQALKTFPAKDIDGCKFLMSLLKWIKEKNAHTSYPETWSVIKPWMDLALKESYEHARAAKKPGDIWWAAKRPFADLVMDVSACDKCMVIKSDFSSVEQDLYKVVVTKTGQAMFGPSLKELQRGKVSLVRKNTVDVLLSHDIEKDVHSSSREAFINKLKEMGIDAKRKFPKPVTTEIPYLGAPVYLPCTSHYDQYLMAEAAAVEGLAVETKVLKSLWCEMQLVGQGRAAPTIRLDPDLVAGAKLSRESLERSIGTATPSGQAIQELIKEQKQL